MGIFNKDDKHVDKRELSELTLEELRDKAKTAKTATWFLVVVIAAVSVLLAYRYKTTGEMTVLLLVPVASALIVVLNVQNIKKIKAEIEKRSA